MAAAKKAAAPRRARSSETGEGFSGLRVSAPLVQIQLGKQVLHLFDGDFVPEGVSKEQIDHLSGLGYVTKGDEPAEPESE